MKTSCLLPACVIPLLLFAFWLTPGLALEATPEHALEQIGEQFPEIAASFPAEAEADAAEQDTEPLVQPVADAEPSLDLHLGLEPPLGSTLDPTLDPTDDLSVAPLPFGNDRDATVLQSLEALQRALASKERQVFAAQQELIAAEDNVTRQELADRLRALRRELDMQREQFERFAVDIDLRPFSEAVEQRFDWQDELSKLLRPIIAELESATSESRAIGELRAQINDVAEQNMLASEATQRLETLLASDLSAELEARLQERLTHWRRVENETANRHTALELQLQNRLDQRQSMLDETTGYAKRFFRTRGMNLLIAVSAFCAVFFGIRWLATLVGRLRGNTKAHFANRLTALLVHVFSVLGGLLAMMLVFNMAGDWFMLGIIIVFLLGIGWASINTLPSQIETVKLVLNIGPVREGERILFDDLPYRVDTLGFMARLVNPLLDGGVQQIPVKLLVGHYSRPLGEREEWFPTRAGDWVELSDGRLGRIDRQTPSAVHLRELGGAQTVYPTALFVQLNPRILSEQFRIVATFGIDYRHQAQATGEIPQRMREALARELPTVAEQAEDIKAIEVFFHHAGASSLDYEIQVDVAGGLAARLPALRNAIPRILVDTCNVHGWGIPFTQITVHQADVAAV